MPEKRIQFNNVVQNQLPAYTQNEFPLVSEFLKQYYLGQEFQGGPIDLIQNIDQYTKVSEQTNLIDAVGLSTSVDQFTDVIPVDMTEYPAGTYGFPDSYGLIKIGNEIITYTGTATTCFTGCVRGFCGISSYKSETDPDVLVFDSTTSEEHTGGSKIQNLSTLFLKQFLLKTKNQLLPGLEDRSLHKDLDQNIFIKQSKDFYLSKGTDKSFEILFKALYNEEVEIIRPRDFLFTPSNANYRIENQYVVESIEGEGNPIHLENSTLIQDEYKKDFNRAYAPISSIEPINTGAGKTYYKLGIDGGYNRDSRVEGSTYGKFEVHPKTRIIGQVSSGSTSLDVDSTVGFPTSGELYCTYSDGTAGIVSYSHRNLTQFFDCTNINGTIPNATDVGINTYVYGTSSEDATKVVKVRIGSVLDKLEWSNNTRSYGKGDVAKIKTLGISDKTFKGKDWFFNVAASYKIKNVEIIDSADFTYKVNLNVDHFLKVGDTITILQGGIALQTSTILNINSARSFNVKGQGEITDESALTLRRNISKAVSNTYPTVTPYSTGVQNVYVKDNNKYLVASGSIPSYYAQPLNVSNQAVVFSGQFEGTEFLIKQSGDHGFYTGDAVYYSPEKISQKFYNAFGQEITEIVDGPELFDEGLYFVKRINSSTIKLATSRTNISNGLYVSVDNATTVINSRLEPYDFRFKTLQSQDLLREFVDPEFDNEEPITTLPGFTGMLVNGVEILNYKASDTIIYGQLNKVDVTAPGRDFDVINPPVLHISDSVGTGATGYVAVDGSLNAIKVIDPGFDYEETPVAKVSGGNGQGAVVSVNMKQISHQVDFFADADSQKIGIGTTSNNSFQIGFSTYHKFRNAEKVVYYTYGQQAVAGIVTNAQYYARNIGVTTITLHKTEADAISGINTITLTATGIGKQSIASVNKKSVVGSFNIISSGSGYENKKTTTNTSGINTATDIITVSNHGYNSGEIVNYTVEGTVVGGLTNSTDYYLTKITDDSFKLSSVGINTNDREFNYRTKQYIDFTTIGVGTHIFNYQPITISVKGKVGISSIAGDTFECETQPIFRGSIKSVHLTDNGVGYGSSDIINFNRQPQFKLIAGSQAQLTPVINNGQIVEVLVQNVGKEYNSPPDLALIGDGVGAVLTPVLENNTITSVKVIEGGAGYTQSNTTITVVVPGDGAEFDASIKNWRINLFQRHYDNFTVDDGFIADEFNENKGLQYSHLYAPRKLRESLYGTVGAGSTVSKIQYGKRDLSRLNSLEIPSTDHSPIIGWAYDGNPIYGPYGYSKRSGGVVRQLTSGYKLSLKSNRPPINQFPEGFFVEDYVHNNVTEETVLDENNGRFCVTPEFPNGTYAYFATITDGVSDSTGPFAGYKRPVFPYLIGENYYSTPNDFNFSSFSNQEQYLLQDTDWIRNTVAYNLIEGKDNYEYVYIPDQLKQTVDITSVTPGLIKSIGIQTSGTQYRVGDKVLFNNSNTEGNLASAIVSKVIGKDVTNVSVATSTVTSMEIFPREKGQYILYANKPHGWSNNDLVIVSGLSTTSSGIGGVYKAGITSNSYKLIGFGTQPTGIGTDGVTGIITYFNINGDFTTIDPNDILRIGTEKIKVLQVEPENNRIRALRAQEGTTGAAHTASTVLFDDPRKLTINAGFNTTYSVKLNTEIYFSPNVTVSVGSTIITPAGLAIGDTATATATLGAGTSEGKVITLTVTDGGSEYASVPTVTFSAPEGSVPTITVGLHTVGTGTTTAINPASVSIASSGIGYATAPTITISDSFLSSGGIQTAVGIATISTAGFVTAVSFNVVDPWAVGTGATIGFGYSTAPTLSFSAPTDLTTAEATAVLTADVVTSLTLTNAGAGYTSAPTIAIVDPDAAPVYQTGVGLGATIQLSQSPNYPNKRTVGTPAGGFPRGRGSAGAGLTEVKVPFKTIFLPNHGFETGDQVEYYPNLGSGILVRDDVVTQTGSNYVGNTTSILQSGEKLFIAKVSDNLIGISTVLVGLDTSGNNFVGVAESVRQSSTLNIIGIGTGLEHSFKTVYNPITADVARNLVTVSTGSSHGLLKDDEIDLTINPSSISTTFTVKYNDFNRRIVINPKDFTAAGINTTTNEITITNHGLLTGQEIIHTATTSSVGLSNNAIYYTIRIDENTIKLADTNYNATLLKPITLGITSASAGTINPINPPVRVYRNQSAIFDLSDSSLGYVNQSTTYSAFDLNFYTDRNLTEKWETDKTDETFNVTKVGKAGVDANASVTLSVNEYIPNILYYTLDVLEESDTPLSKRSIIKKDTLVNDASEVQTVSSRYNGKFNVSVGATNAFTYTLSHKPEASEYTSTTSILSYETESSTAFGGVSGFEIRDSGKNYYSVPGIATITSDTGKGALINVKSDSIGKINKVHIKDIGFDFPSDPTLSPSVGLPQIITIENLASIKSIGISSVGRGYTTAPKLLVFDGITNKRDYDIDLDYSLGDQQVTILKNTKGLSNVQPTIIPTNASNGVGINTVGFNTTTKDVSVTLSVGFSTAGSFPFLVGDKVLVEGVSVGVGTTARGYNSAEYDYKLFEITAVDPNIGGLGIVTYSVYNEFKDLDPRVTPGQYNEQNSVGRLIPEKYFPIFNIKLGIHDYLEGEIVQSNSAIGTVENWDSKLGELRVSASEDFTVDETIRGLSSETLGIASSIRTYDASIKTNIFTKVNKGWETDSGVLNYNMQRIQDSYYYQNFSYSLRSKVAYQTWNDVVSALNHTTGHIKFSDLQLDSLNDNSMSVGLTTETTSYEIVNDLYGIGNLNCVHDFDLVTENSKNIGDDIVSDEIIFASRILTDYDESVGNRVLSIDDISGSFNHRPRATQYSVANEFDITTTRARKSFHYIMDKRFTGERQLMVTNVVHDHTFGYLSQYGNGGNVYDIGSFDFAIVGEKGQLRFYPRNYKVNDFYITTVSYNLDDEYLGIGTTSVGVALIESHSTEAAKSDASTVIVGIASTYRSAKVLVSINPDQSKITTGEFEYDELNIIHDGSTIDLVEYDQLVTVPGDYTSSGVGTYSVGYSGSDIQLSWHPDSSNAGVGTTAVINTITIGIGNSDYSGVGTFTMKHSKFNTKSTTIAAASVGTTSVIAEYITQTDSATDGYDAGYFIVQLTDTTNGSYNMAEMLVMDDYLLAEEDGNTLDLEYGNIGVSGIGTLGSRIVADTNAGIATVQLLCTPTSNIGIQAQVFMQALKVEDDSKQNISFDNGAVTSEYSDYKGTERDVKKAFDIQHESTPIFNRSFTGNSDAIVSVDNNTITIPNHFFVTGEKVTYTHVGTGSSGAVGIAATNGFAGVGNTTLLPSDVFVVKINEDKIKIAATAEKSLRSIAETVNITTVGVGTSHRFTSTNQNAKVIVSLDNIIQSPVVATAVTTQLAVAAKTTDDIVYFTGITSFTGADLFRIGSEIMRIDSVGVGSTNAIRVRREWLGTNLAGHSTDSLVTKVNGNYNIVENVLNFTEAPYGNTPLSTTTNPPDSRDWTGIATSSSFSGRMFMRSGETDTSNETYYQNYIFDDLSQDFNGTTSSFDLKTSQSNVTGIATENAIILLNDVFQGPVLNYDLNENAGVTSITFTGAGTSIAADVNTSQLPIGGVIVSVGSTEGMGYQPIVAAGGTAVVSSAGTISAITLGYAGSGYRSGIGQTVRVAIQTSSLEGAEVVRYGTATIGSAGAITGIAITNTNVIYKPRDIQNVGYNSLTGITTITTAVAHGLDNGEAIKLSGIAFTCDYASAVSISTVGYTTSTGIMTVSTYSAHGLSTTGSRSQAIFTGLAFTCSLDNGVYQHIYPRNKDRVFNTAVSVASTTSTTITVDVTAAKSLDQYVHTFVGPGTEAVIAGGTYGHKFIGIAQSAVVSGGDYLHTFVSSGVGSVTVTGIGTTTATGATYDASTGDLVLTIVGHGATTGNTIGIATGGIVFTCSMDDNGTNHPYPRSTDPLAGYGTTDISSVTDDTITINVGTSKTVPHAVEDAVYDAPTGILTMTIPSHGLSSNRSIRFTPYSLAFTCDMDQHGSIHTYPRITDPAYNTAVSISATTTDTITVNVGASTQTKYNVTAANYGAATGILTMTVGSGHSITAGDSIKFKKEGLTFTCTKDGNATRHKYPREGDPTYNGVDVLKVNSTTEFEVNIGISTVLSHYTGVGTAKVQPVIIAPRAVNNSASGTDAAEPGVNVLSIIDDYSFIVDTGVSTLPHNYARGGTISKPMKVVIDEPQSYTNIPLDYATPAVGVGTNATIDIVVSLGGSVRDFKLNNSGNGYGNLETLRVPFGGTTGIPTTSSFTNNPFELTIDEIYSDEFTGWSLGTLESLDDWNSKFDGNTTVFQLQRAGDTLSIRSSKGSKINVQDVILIFINDIMQVPGQGYRFTGGSNVTFTEAPKVGDTSKIIFYKGSGGIDVVSKEIIETVKKGDDLTIEDGSEPFYMKENVRGVSTVSSTDTVNTVPYYGPGNTENESLLRPVVWCRQTEDRVINEELVGKDRELYNANINPTAFALNSVGIGSTVIFVSNVRPFFDPTNENQSATLRSTIQDKIDILPQLTRTGAAGTALVSTAGTVTGVTLSTGGEGYTTATVSFASTTGVSTSSQAMGSVTVASGSVTAIAITNPGVGYTQTDVPLVSISPPTLISETDTVRSYAGDSGTIVGFGTTTISSSSQLIFDLFIPLDSYLRDTTLTGTAVTICGLTTGAMFMVYDSNVGVGSTRVTSVNSGLDTIGIGHSYVDNVYEVADCEGQYINVTGVGFTYIKRVFAKIDGQVSGSYSGITSSNYQGSFSWGKIIVSRSEENAYTAYTQSGIGTNNLTGISTSFIIRRTNPLKSKSYT